MAAGINLPYECGSGTCGTCKARLIEGEVDDRWPEAAGRKYLKQPGEFLMCQCVARNDCTVEVAGFVYNMDPGACIPEFRAGTIRDTKALTRDVMSFSVELARPGRFRCRPVRGDAGARRPRLPRLLDGELRARRDAARFRDQEESPAAARRNGCSTGARKARTSTLFGPLGAATFYPNLGKNILCIAGGSGIAGMMSILSRARQERYFDQFNGYVFFGVRTFGDGFYLGRARGARRASSPTACT